MEQAEENLAILMLRNCIAFEKLLPVDSATEEAATTGGYLQNMREDFVTAVCGFIYGHSIQKAVDYQFMPNVAAVACKVPSLPPALWSKIQAATVRGGPRRAARASERNRRSKARRDLCTRIYIVQKTAGLLAARSDGSTTSYFSWVNF